MEHVISGKLLCFFLPQSVSLAGFPGGSVVKNLPANGGELGSINPCVGKITWRRAWKPTPVSLPGKSPGQRSLAGYTLHGVGKSWTGLSKHAHSHPSDVSTTVGTTPPAVSNVKCVGMGKATARGEY